MASNYPRVTDLGIPEGKGLQPTKDFLRAASKLDPMITKIWIADMEKKACIGTRQ